MTTDFDSNAWMRHELTHIVREVFGGDEAFATRKAADVLDRIRHRVGGCEIYIQAPDTKQRNEAIRAKFNGCNIAEVMREFGVSRATVYRACKVKVTRG